jgi:tetratricopeptide (TPR) repeat protein
MKTEPGGEERIRELKRRITLNPASPHFVGLAEEYRAAGQFPEAIGALEKGLEARPGYVSARVALARAYLEAGRTEDAAAMFAKALELDPANLVSARCLADIHLSRGASLEAVKRYKLYRALSGDRSVDEIIEKLEAEIGPAAPAASDAQGRVLADLYFDQGHFAEAFAAYEGLSSAHPSDAGLARQKSEAADRLAAAVPPAAVVPPAAAAPPSPAPPPDSDPGARRRGARIEALKRWLAVIQIH